MNPRVVAVTLACLACQLLQAEAAGLVAGSAGQGAWPGAWPGVLWSVPALALVVALLSAALPAWGAYRADVATLLRGDAP